MKKITKILLFSLLVLSFTSCGTIMERRSKLITVNTNISAPVKLYLNGMPIGTQKQLYVKSTGWSKDNLMAEDTKTGERLMIPLDYTFNGWSVPSIFFGLIGLGVDLIAGSYTKLDNTYYYVNFDENTVLDLEDKDTKTTPKN